jgi:hypothetical protein
MNKIILLITGFIITVSISAQKYVQVRDEPRHHNVFENEFVRILDVHLGPSDTTQYHLHNTPSVFILFTNTKVGSQLLGGLPIDGANVSGMISFDSIAQPRIHRVWNKDTGWFHVIDAELVSKKKPVNIPLIELTDLNPLFNEALVNGYQLDLQKDKSIILPATKNGYLLISLGEGLVEYKINEVTHHRRIKAGHYTWVESGKKLSIVNKNGTSISFTLLQFK